MAETNARQNVTQITLSGAGGDARKADLIEHVQYGRKRNRRFMNADKEGVADRQLGQVAAQFMHVSAEVGVRFERQKLQEMVDKGVMRRRVKLPLQGRQDLPFHLFNVTGAELSAAQIGQGGNLDLFPIVNFDRNVQSSQGNQQGRVARAHIVSCG